MDDVAVTGMNQLHIDLGINLFATQLVAENDSFGPDYDAGAAWTGDESFDWYFTDPEALEFTIESAEELAGLAALVNGTATAPVTTYAVDGEGTVHDDFKGQTINLAANIDLRDVEWTPIGRIGTSSTDFTYAFQGTFDGGNHTISNLNVSNDGWAGLFGIAYGATIKNVKINGASIMSNRMAGTLVGQLYGSIDNCHVSGVDIMVVPNVVGDSYDNGDKVGGIVGWIGDNNNKRTLTNCSVTDSEIGAYRDVGGIAGYAAWSTTISGNKVTETDITVDQTTYFYGEKDPNAGEIWGRNSESSNGDGVIAENNTKENNTITMTYVKNGLTLKASNDDVTLYLVPADYSNETVNVPEGVAIIGGYAFAYNDSIETIVLPSTVTTLSDRAFRDTSASTVVLNKGLTNISYQAFRNASNVKSVEIPSTVTTISKEAFQNSGITTLTIPATVTTLEYGACRDMKELETVTIEGNVDIPVYAFRACTNLKSVILTGDDVKFGGGSRGMIFTNKENGDGSAITVIVMNETVKERLLAADTAAKDYNGYTIVVAEGITTEEDLYYGAYDNNTYILSDDLDADNMICFGLETDNTIYLNNNTITGSSDNILFYAFDNGILTIEGDGTVKTNAGYAGYASNSGSLNINGGTFMLGETNNKAHLYSQNSATIVINDGTFISQDANTPIVYCINGFIEINGGFFQNTANPNAALLSMGNNLSYINNQKITLRGGTFVNWNPMVDSSFAYDWPQCPALIVLADGYKVVSETQANGDVWHTIVPK